MGTMLIKKEDDIIDAVPIYSLYRDITSRMELRDKSIVYINQNTARFLDNTNAKVRYEEYKITDINNSFIPLADNIANTIIKYYGISGWINKLECLGFLVENYLEYFVITIAKTSEDIEEYINLILNNLVSNFEDICSETLDYGNAKRTKYRRTYILDSRLFSILKPKLLDFIKSIEVSLSLTKLVENITNNTEVKFLLKVDIEENRMFTNNTIKVLLGFVENNIK